MRAVRNQVLPCIGGARGSRDDNRFGALRRIGIIGQRAQEIGLKAADVKGARIGCAYLRAAVRTFGDVVA